jgi:hypothetical protein
MTAAIWRNMGLAMVAAFSTLVAGSAYSIFGFMFMCFMFHAHIKFLQSGPFYVPIKHKTHKHKKVTEILSHFMRTRTTKTHYTFFHLERRFQGTVTNKNKLRRAIHKPKFFYVYTFYVYMLKEITA